MGGTQLQVITEDGGELLRADPGDDPWGFVDLGLVDQSARLQNTLGVFFPIPEDLDQEDQMWISIFDRLLHGEVVEMPWSEREIGMTVRAGESDRVAESLTGDPSQFSIVTETYTLEIDGNRLTIGVDRPSRPVPVRHLVDQPQRRIPMFMHGKRA